MWRGSWEERADLSTPDGQRLRFAGFALGLGQQPEDHSMIVNFGPQECCLRLALMTWNFRRVYPSNRRLLYYEEQSDTASASCGSEDSERDVVAQRPALP